MNSRFRVVAGVWALAIGSSVGAATTADQAMLKSIGFTGFERAHSNLCKRLSAYLEEGWVVQ